MILGKIPRKHILLDGPKGSGKRMLARAIGNEFGGKVVELDPGSVTNRTGMVDIFSDLGRDDALVMHNIDEWCDEAQSDTACVMIDRALRREAPKATRSNPFAAAFENDSEASATEKFLVFEPFIMIVTTNAFPAINDRLGNNCLHFTLTRSREAMTIATERALRYNAIPADSKAVSILVDYFMVAHADVAEETIALVISHLMRLGAIALLPEMAAQVVQAAWSFQSIGVVARCVKSTMADMETEDLQAVATYLLLPPALTVKLAKVLKKNSSEHIDIGF